MSENRTPNIERIAKIFKVLGQPARLRLLLEIGYGEACVCHLESATGLRQAYISQHLMALREAGIVSTRREGRNIYYRLRSKKLPPVIQAAGEMAGVDPDELRFSPAGKNIANCCCPHCSPGDRESGLPSTAVTTINLR